MICWREYKNLIVALISDCEDVNLANQSVFLTFLLKELENLKVRKKRKQRNKEAVLA